MEGRVRFSERMQRRIDGLTYDHRGRCYYCGNELSSDAEDDAHLPSIDHGISRKKIRKMLPVQVEGVENAFKNDITARLQKYNLVLSCKRCNCEKGSTPRYIFERRKRRELNRIEGCDEKA
jgi:hypothetical protein